MSFWLTAWCRSPMPTAELKDDLQRYKVELGRMGLEDLLRQLCYEIARQRIAIETGVGTIKQAAAAGGLGNLAKIVFAGLKRRG